jgi:hypothetical protein
MAADRKAHEVAMTAHLAQQAMATTLAAGATTKKALAAGHAASATILGEEGLATM